MNEPSITQALRDAADLLDEHPDLPQPYVTSSSAGTAHLAWYLTVKGYDLAEQKQLAAHIIRTIGGKWDKHPGDDFNFRCSRGLLTMTVQVQREAVCRRRVTGTETVTIPAKPAEPECTVEQEIVEWDCEPILEQVSA